LGGNIKISSANEERNKSLFDEEGRPIVVSELVRCLAMEEQKYHLKKTMGAGYFLNQEILLLLAGSDELVINPEFLPTICQDKIIGPSARFLEILLEQKFNIFTLDLSKLGKPIHITQHVVLNELIDRAPTLLTNYLSYLQGSVADPYCFLHYFPELATFQERIKYLEEDLDNRELLANTEVVRKIFNKLRGIDKIRQKCNHDPRVLRYEREKKALENKNKTNGNIKQTPQGRNLKNRRQR